MDYRNYQLSRRERIKLWVISFVFMVIVSVLFYDNLWLLMLTPMAVKIFYKPYLNHVLSIKRKIFLNMFKDFLYSISASFSTGRHLLEAMKEARATLKSIYGDEGVLVKEVEHMIALVEHGGMDELQILQEFSDKTNMEDVSNFVITFKGCRDSGGDIVKAVIKGAKAISEKITIDNDIRVMTSQKKFEGRIITFMPILIIVFLRSFSKGYMDIMYGTVAGTLVMTMALLGIFIAYYLIERITTFDI